MSWAAGTDRKRPGFVGAAIVFAIEGGQGASLAGWSLVVIALVVASDVWKWFRHVRTPLGIDFCMIFQTNHLAAMILKTSEIFPRSTKRRSYGFLGDLEGGTNL